uniref:Ig-like domain-containing protein n=1 Tax=Chrysemys picta bellii TaxID=8478 RepID=A0A8C3HYT1_CHRPI
MEYQGRGLCLPISLLLVCEPPAPGPSISISPSGVIAPGGAVTIRCQCRCGARRFLLYKDGNPNALQDMEPAGDLAEFPIRNVSWRDAGNYSCYYHHKLYPFIWSHPSDPVDLVVAGEWPGSVSSLPVPPPARPSGAGACARGTNRSRGPPNQWGRSSDLLRGAEPAPLAAGGTQSTPPIAATFLFLCTPLIRGSLHQWGARWALHLGPAEGTPGWGAGTESLGVSPGLTYTELDHEALQGKWSSPAPAPEPAQPSVYAAINVNWGPHEQSPRGVRAPSPTYPLP